MLYIIANRFFLTLFLLDQLEEGSDAVKILHPVSPKGIRSSLTKFYESVFLKFQKTSKFYPESYISELQKIKPDDSVLIFGIENIKELMILKRFIDSKNISLFTWNPVIDYRQSKFFRKIHVGSLKRLNFNFCTFDPGDAKKYQLKLIHQVYRDVSTFIDREISETTDVYFVGQDKGRLTVLKAWMSLLKNAGMTVNFCIFREKRFKYSDDDALLISNKYMEYGENIIQIQKSRCLFELLQSNQSGQTIRSLESAFFQKKLITNNASIRGTPLYDPARVFIIGEDNPDEIKEFMARPFDKVPEVVLKNHDFKNWIKQFKFHHE